MRISFLIWLTFAPALLQAQSLEELCKQRVDFEETPGIAVAWYEDGKANFFNYGLANISNQEPVTSKTLFEIGSITKTFTCSVFSQLVLQNELGLNDLARNHLPASFVLPEKNGKAITLFHLATAHSGLPRMPGNFSPLDPANPYIDYTEKELTGFLNNVELMRDPGSQYEYSNLGMGLLGYILTKKKNTTYSKLVKQTIFNPLEMKQTFISGENKPNKLFATGYLDKTPMKPWTWSDQSVLTGAGGIVSNTEDMMKYLMAQLGVTNSELTAAFQQAHKERTDAGKLTTQIGLGWHIMEHKYVWHNGGTGGFRSFIGFDPEKKRGIIILTNSTNGADDLGFFWLNSIYPLKAIKRPFKIEAERLKEYEGTYEINPQFKIAITAEGATLMLQATGQQKVSIYAEAVDKFYLKVVPARVEFSRNGDSKVEKLTLYQNGAAIEGKKMN